MAVKPYLIFGGQGKPQGGLADYIGAHFTKDEAAAQLATLQLAWWELAVYNDDGLQKVSSSETPAPKKSKTTVTRES